MSVPDWNSRGGEVQSRAEEQLDVSYVGCHTCPSAAVHLSFNCSLSTVEALWSWENALEGDVLPSKKGTPVHLTELIIVPPEEIQTSGSGRS